MVMFSEPTPRFYESIERKCKIKAQYGYENEVRTTFGHVCITKIVKTKPRKITIHSDELTDLIIGEEFEESKIVQTRNKPAQLTKICHQFRHMVRAVYLYEQKNPCTCQQNDDCPACNADIYLVSFQLVEICPAYEPFWKTLSHNPTNFNSIAWKISDSDIINNSYKFLLMYRLSDKEEWQKKRKREEKRDRRNQVEPIHLIAQRLH